MHQYGANWMNPMASVAPLPVLEALTTAVLVTDTDSLVCYLNPATEALLEISAQRAHGQSLGELLPIGATLQAALLAAAEGSSTTLREIALARPGSETPLLLDCTVAPFTAWPGNGLVVVELARVDQLMRITREAWLQERQDALHEIVRALAHEIKNPLGGLRGAAQLLDRELPRRELREYTRIITHEADRLGGLVDRMTGSFRVLGREPFNLHAVLEHVRKLTLVEIPEGLVFERDYDPSIPELTGDREQMVQAVLNIVRNAVQAMAGRGVIALRTRVRHQFTLHNRRHRLAVEVWITDDGPGIDPAMIEKVFFPMVTGRADGTGLGLAIAQEAVNRHGGTIECVSRPGKTRFTLYLPVEGDA